MGQTLSDSSGAVVQQAANVWVERAKEEYVDLPADIRTFKEMIKKGLAKDLLRSGFKLGYNDLPPEKQQIIKYSGSALLHGRALRSVIITTAGETGRGKSTTIQRFFDDQIYNPDNDRTKLIHEYTKEIRATAENPAIVGMLKFIDIPGALDEDPERNVENFARLKLVRNMHVELKDRFPDAELKERNVSVRKEVFPNLVLLVASATDNIASPESKFRKSAFYLKASGMVDKSLPNLIVVVTRAMEFEPYFKARSQTMKTNVQAIILHVFGIPSVPVVYIENKFESYRGGEIQEGDFYKLPNGESNYANLKEAMESCFKNNNDSLATQFISHYFHPECPEKKNDRPFKCNKEFYNTAPTPQNLDEARNALALLGIYTGTQATFSNAQFSFLGRGFCPKTEKTKSFNTFNDAEYAVVEINKLKRKLQIPRCVQMTENISTDSELLNFTCKDAYEKYRAHKYGLSAGMELVVSGNFGTSWGGGSNLKSSSEIMKFEYKYYIAKLEIRSLEDQVCQQLIDDVNALPAAYDIENQDRFDLFFDKYGTHIIRSLQIGGSFVIECQVDKSEFNKNNKTEFELDLETKFKKTFDCAIKGTPITGESKAMLSRFATSKVTFHGGDPPSDVTLVKDMSHQKLAEWLNTVQALDPLTELSESIELEPYYNLSRISEDRRLALKMGTLNYLKNDSVNMVSVNKAALSEAHAKAGKKMADENAQSGGCCFPPSAIVATKNRGPIPIAQLRYGDMLCSGGTDVSKFYTYLHFDPNARAIFLEVYMGQDACLQITPDHLLYKVSADGGNLSTVPARSIKVGDHLLQQTSFGYLKPNEVSKIDCLELVGLYSPLAGSGKFLANGILVSSFSNIKSQRLAQLSMVPLRVWYELKKSTHEENPISCHGIHTYAKALIKLRALSFGGLKRIGLTPQNQ